MYVSLCACVCTFTCVCLHLCVFMCDVGELSVFYQSYFNKTLIGHAGSIGGKTRQEVEVMQ